MLYCLFILAPLFRYWVTSCLGFPLNLIVSSHPCQQIMCRCSTALENSVKEKISMFCHVEPEQVRRWSAVRGVCLDEVAALNSPSCLSPGHLCARRVFHLQSTVTAGESGCGGLSEQETEHAYWDPAQENVDQMEGDVWQASPQTIICL